MCDVKQEQETGFVQHSFDRSPPVGVTDIKTWIFTGPFQLLKKYKSNSKTPTLNFNGTWDNKTPFYGLGDTFPQSPIML